MKRVLIIDDDEKVAKAIGLRVSSAGYQSFVAHDALNGVVAAAKAKPDAVLLDINMPGGNGFSVAERIHTILQDRVPIIFITASRKPGLVDRAVALGAAGFIEKPYSPDELLGLLHNLLNKPLARIPSHTGDTRWYGIND